MSFSFFGFRTGNDGDNDLPDIFPMAIKHVEFVKNDMIAIFTKILTDVVERTHGIKDEQMTLLWDNCLQSEVNDGLITMLAKAITGKDELFLVYDRALNLLRLAKPPEQTQIKADYAKANKSNTGVFISFRNYVRSDMVKIYSALEYLSVSSLTKSMNISKAVQIKMADLRKSVSLTDSAETKAQAKKMAQALAAGRDIMLDAGDDVVTAKPDVDSIEKSMEFIDGKRSFYLGLPKSYITGEQTGGLNSTGEGDSKAIERGLKNYYFSIIKPAVEAIFDVKTTYKTDNFRQINSSLELLKTFNLTDDTLISAENKLAIVNAAFGLPEDAKGDAPPSPEPLQVPLVG